MRGRDPARLDMPRKKPTPRSDLPEPPRVHALDVVRHWPPNARDAAQRVLSTHGEPDDVAPDAVIWRQASPWQRVTVRRDERPGTIVEAAIEHHLQRRDDSSFVQLLTDLHVTADEATVSVRGPDLLANVLTLNSIHAAIEGELDPDEAASTTRPRTRRRSCRTPTALRRRTSHPRRHAPRGGPHPSRHESGPGVRRRPIAREAQALVAFPTACLTDAARFRVLHERVNSASAPLHRGWPAGRAGSFDREGRQVLQPCGSRPPSGTSDGRSPQPRVAALRRRARDPSAPPSTAGLLDAPLELRSVHLHLPAAGDAATTPCLGRAHQG